MATNYDILKQLMTEDELTKRVEKSSIVRWGSSISTDGAKEALASLVEVSRAILEHVEDQRLSDVTTISNQMSALSVSSTSEKEDTIETISEKDEPQPQQAVRQEAEEDNGDNTSLVEWKREDVGIVQLRSKSQKSYSRDSPECI
jgi:hypothetical protein